LKTVVYDFETAVFYFYESILDIYVNIGYYIAY